MGANQCLPDKACGSTLTLFTQSSSSTASGWWPVDLAVSEFPTKDWIILPGQKVFHTSIVLDFKEYYFNPQGLQEACLDRRYEVPASHQGKTNTNVFQVGVTRKNGSQLKEALRRFFRAGSYDIIVKNCNKFTDVALSCLLSRRLPKRYTKLENLGASHQGALSLVSGGKYSPNPKALGFDVEAVILQVDPNAWLGTAEAVQTYTPTALEDRHVHKVTV